MKTITIRAAALAMALAFGAVASDAGAHHSRAQFRLDQLTTLKAKITRVRWSNPHVFYAGMVTNDKGVAEEWVFEGHSISGLVRQGWSPNLIKVGDEVEVMVNRHRDPSQRFALLDRVILANGKTYYSIGVPPPEQVAKHAPIQPSKDFSGNWKYKFPGTAEEVRRRVLLGSGGPRTDLPYTTTAKAQAAKYDANKAPALTCEPISIPAILMTVYEYKWIRRADRIVIEKEQYTDMTRTIWLNRSTPPAGYKPNPMGFSVGRFEPDGTLVVETTRFGPVRWGNQPGVDSSEKKKLVERYRLIDGGMGMSLSYTQEDPEYFTAPVTANGTFTKSYDSTFPKQPPCDLEAAQEHLHH